MPRQHVETQRKEVPFYLIKADEAQGIVESIVSVMGIIDLGDDIIENGAYRKTILERRNKIRVLDNHNTDSTMRAVGIPLEMREVDAAELATLAPQVLIDFPEATGGLYCKTQFLMETPEGKGVFQRIAANAINEWSIGYDAIETAMRKVFDPQTGKEKVCRILKVIRLWEYSPVLWGMNQATAVVGVKDRNMPKAVEAAIAANYREAAQGAAQTCATCRFYREINETSGYCKHFDFIAGPEDVSDAWAGGKSDAPDAAPKEYTPNGAQTRLGDYLVGKTYDKYMSICNSCLQEGMLSDTEHRSMCELGLKLMDTMRAGLTDDVSLRPYGYGGMDMFMLWGADGADLEKMVEAVTDPQGKAQLIESIKAGRVLSAKNATKISAAVDTLLEVLISAGVYTSAETEDQPGDDSGKGERGAGPVQTESPTDYMSVLAELEADIALVEIGGLEHASS